jgi:F0F1-type ATP synthase assembly protein I
MKPPLLLLGGSLAFWVLLAVPARLIWGDQVAVEGGVACLICTLPALATSMWIFRTRNQRPAQQMAAILGGTGLRMFGVLFVALALYFLVPWLQDVAFWIWLLVFYMFTLALEMTLVLKNQSDVVQEKVK